MKTGYEWFKELPYPYNELSLEEIRNTVYNAFSMGYPDGRYESLSCAIYYSFSHNVMGYDFWYAIMDELDFINKVGQYKHRKQITK